LKYLAGRGGGNYLSPDLMSTAATTGSKARKFLGKFTVLRGAPRELWIIYAAYILENLAYKLSSGSVLPLWLSHELGMEDTTKGLVIGIWSALMTLFTVLVGSFTDAAGIRRTFLLGFGICIFARAAMLFTAPLVLPLGLGLFPLALGLALMTPVMTAAMKRYSTVAQRSVAFSLYYALMNLGFAIGDRLFDHLRHTMGEYGTWTVPVLGVEFSTYRVIILWSVVFTVPGLLLVWGFLREGVEMAESGVSIKPSAALTAARESVFAATTRIFGGLWRQPAFYRFLLFMALVVGVRMIFYHMNYTLPDFSIRELGKGAPFAQLCNMLNSLLILVMVPVCGVLSQKISAYRMVTAGSLISALSVFLLALPPSTFQPLADGWLGDWVVHKWLHVAGPVNPLYISIFLFTVVLSVGEALWSPRLYEYAAAIAPKGQEASYMALSVLPYFFAKFGAGLLSGWLLATFCPADGARHTEMMWLIVGGMAMVTPLGTFLFRKHIQVHEEGR
jgi:MFS family permease